jgi:hypothetical protein
MIQKKTLCAAASLALLLGGCQTATPYQPLGASRTSGGYSDQRIEPDRYRVTFAGNSVTSRETVENYLLYRAAELTVEQGYDWFVMADRDTERRSRTVVDRPFRPGPYGYWGPSWRYYGWDRDIDIRTIDRYEATAEIVLGRGRKPSNDPRAFDARSVLEAIGPRVVPPA